MSIRALRLLWLVPLLILGGCASGPAFDTTRVDKSITPRSAVAELAANTGKTVLWGGVILSTANLENTTRIEVLAYPLDSSQMPLRDRDPLGRFMLERRGFLEPASYTEGRMVTVTGTLVRTQQGKVGGSDYTYPVVEADKLYLWSKDSEYNNRSNVHFGIGVGIGL
jgi:outer membrane lipoprotein